MVIEGVHAKSDNRSTRRVVRVDQAWSDGRHAGAFLSSWITVPRGLPTRRELLGGHEPGHVARTHPHRPASLSTQLRTVEDKSRGAPGCAPPRCS